MKTISSTVTLARLLCFSVAAASVGCGSSSNSATQPSRDAGVDAASPVADAGSGAPVTGLKSNEWVWVPVEGAYCRDGSKTGFAVNLASPRSDKLMIYLEAGGACMDQFFCTAAATPLTFGASEFVSWKAGSGSAPSKADAGLFNRRDSKNPVAGWNMVYVPYCTGDIFAGANPKGMVPKVGPQQFVGYTDVHLDLERIVPTFPGTKKVLLTGSSAGAFGAYANYEQATRAFGSSTPIYVLADSGAPMEAPYVAECAQSQLADLWGKEGALADCGSDCSNPKTYFLDFVKHLTKTYPTAPFGVVSSTQDQIMGLFFGYGNPGMCKDSISPTGLLSGAMYTEGLKDVEMKLAGVPNFGAFLFAGTQHTSVETTATLDNGSTNVTPSLLQAGGSTPADAGTIKLTDWIATLVNEGKVSNVGP
ncbi:MAG TPA: pectin acetylesterase-family hydrolase [Polyangiales bacterium]